MSSRGKKEIQRADKERADNQGNDGEDTQNRYDFRERKAVERYQAPLESRSSPARRRYSEINRAPAQVPSCKKNNRRKHAVHISDSTSSSSSDDEEHFERRRKRSRALRRCLPVNFQKDEVKRIHKDRMKIGASLADVDPMQIDCSVRFDGVGGLSEHISALKEMVIFPLLYPEVFERFKIQPPRGCLFYGPPGTGKTLVARALANECSQGDTRIAFFMRKGADCLSKWAGESERQLRLLFDQAYQMRPSIIFFDEIDGLAPVRSSEQDQIHSSIVSTLLALMDGLDNRGEIVVIGATNRLDSVDPALRRPGRFDREFLFSLPNKEARKEIFKIHTREWTPKPLERFLEELAEKCVGYCGADIKSLCAEAALCALRRRYPQIYTSSEKLQLDAASITITAKDFVMALQKTVPASQRAVASPGRALSPISKPLFANTLARIIQALQRVFPHAELALKKDQQQDSLHHVLRNDAIDSDEESPSIFEDKPAHEMGARQNEKFLNFSRNAYCQPTSCRPRFLIVGEPGYGQTSHLAPALIHALEKFPVYTLDLSVLFVSVTSPEETCAQLMGEAQRTAPSVIYVPNIHLWWEAAGPTLKAVFTTLLQNIPAFAPVLLLATSEVCYTHLPTEVKELFMTDDEVFKVELPDDEARRMFFEDLVLNQAAKPPASKNKADMSERKRRRNRVSPGLAKKRRNFQFSKESKVAEDQNEVESDGESPERDVCNIDGTEDESTQGSFREGSENILPEQQKNGTEDETFIFVAKYPPEKIIFMLPEHPDLRMESEMPDSSRAEGSEDRDSNDAWAHCVAHGTHSQVEEQGRGVNEAMEIVGESVAVDYHELKQVLHLVTEISENFDLFHLEKLYALLSQCIYTHRGDDDQTELVKEMKTEIGAFGYAQ